MPLAPTRTQPRQTERDWLPAAFAAIPPLLLASLIANFGVDVPYWDQWDLVPDLEKLDEGRLGLGDLWAQHSEHRVLVPRAMMLALARLTGWDVRYELWLSLLLALTSAGLFLGLWRRARTDAHLAGFPWFAVIASLGFFSLQQWENWIWGWQLTVHLNVLALMAGLKLAQQATPRPLALAGLAGLGLVAQYSFATGLVYWPLLGFVLAARDSGARERRRALAAWSLVSAVCIASYLFGYRKPGWTPDTWLFVERPHHFLAYLLSYLGAPLVPEGEASWRLPWALGAGLVGLVVFLVAARALLSRGFGWGRLGPFVSLAAFAVASATLGGLGRLGLGPEQALTSRYVTLGQLLWLADLALLSLLLSSERVGSPGRRSRLAGGTLAAISLALALASVSSVERFVHAHRLLSAARAALQAREDSPALAVLHPQRELLWRRAHVLERLRLSVYR